MIDALIQFLRACLDNEQHEAEDALKRTTTTRRWIGGQWVEDAVQPPEWRRSTWPPTRVLAEVDAKRRTLIRCEEALLSANPMLVHFAKQTLWEMSLPHADHPDYREEWRP